MHVNIILLLIERVLGFFRGSQFHSRAVMGQLPQFRSTTFTPNSIITGDQQMAITIPITKEDKIRTVDESVEEIIHNSRKKGIKATLLVGDEEVPLEKITPLMNRFTQGDHTTR